MRINSSLFKKTSAYQVQSNGQNRAPVFFLDQLNKLGLIFNVKGISKDLDFNENTHLITSVDVRALSKARLDFLLGTLNSGKFRGSGLLKASILSAFSLKGRLQLNTRGLAGFDGSLLLVLTYADYLSALCSFPDLSQGDFSDGEEAKEWAVLIQSCSPTLISFKGYLFPFEFFKERFRGLSGSSRLLPTHLIYRTSSHISCLFGSSVFKFSKINKFATGAPFLASAAGFSVLKCILSSFVARRLCQQ